jgi:maltose alpha-D-glucosyltransferase / alpha-amylase
MGLFETKRDWYRNAVIYALDVKTYQDSDGDGVGDFKGLTSRLDHLKYLGVDCIWLLPFYPSPLRDNGYDVSDYCGVDPRLGTMEDLEEFMAATQRLGIKVLIDLVINHSSDQHPWFKDARSSRSSRYRHYYVWHEQPDHDEVKVEFDHAEESVWTRTEETGSYYLHRFYKEQPDLNLSHPDVQDEVLRIMDFWIDKGVCSFRIDAAHMITDPVDVENTDYESMHRMFSRMRRHLEKRRKDGVLLAEANVEPEKLKDYFADGSEGDARMHMLFNFIANKYSMLAFARRNGAVLTKGVNIYKPIHIGHWVNFVRHHDELNTDMLDKDEVRDVFEAFAPEKHMQALRGVRRRFPPMVDNDRRRIDLMYNICFSLPGIPLLNYGEEIGMGDDLSLEGRAAVRTPMQWDGSKNAGFSTASPRSLILPVIDHGTYGYERINVALQRKDKHSLLQHIRRLVQERKERPLMGEGVWQVAVINDDRAFALLYANGQRTVLVVHNLSDEAIEIEVFPGYVPERMKETVHWQDHPRAADLRALHLQPYGSRWIDLEGKKESDTIN